MRTHNLGFPRIGAGRELKKAVEGYWKGRVSRHALEGEAARLRACHWAMQRDAGIDVVPVGDFALYDHMLDLTLMLGAIPPRFSPSGAAASPAGTGQDIDLMFRMARGEAGLSPVAPLEMTKWFDTNYHYLVPELDADTAFAPDASPLVAQLREAQDAGFTPKAVLPGPLTWLWLARSVDGSDRFALLPALCDAYATLLRELTSACPPACPRGYSSGGLMVQLDEPVLALDLPQTVRDLFPAVYTRLRAAVPDATLMVASYFAPCADNLPVALNLPVDVLHLDLVRGRDDLDAALQVLGAGEGTPGLALSLGVVDGRNVWCADIDAAVNLVRRAADSLGEDRVWVAPSCSLLHCPVDLGSERELDPEVARWLAFARQKCAEVRLVAEVVRGVYGPSTAASLEANREVRRQRAVSPRIHDPAVASRLAAVTSDMEHRTSPYAERIVAQRAALHLPTLPTTTIGSFPQTPDIRAARRALRDGSLTQDAYEAAMRDALAMMVREQEALGLDVLVHGEPERNDMVEYFGGLLQGFCITSDGWVQSYGTRCVKPPLLYGDVSRPEPMTVAWSAYARSLTARPMKAMLTGPVTIACWSFVRDDISRETVLRQLALALRDEVADLESAGLAVVQVDEPALREGLPLRRAAQEAYLDAAVRTFRLATSGVADATQLHTHMCYCDFHDIIDRIAGMDADVISLEASRSRMELLDVFATHGYPNEVGPGVYDIHSPRVPSVDEMEALLLRAAAVLPVDRLWVNPDCGLKTREWPETRAALANMVEAARRVRARLDA